MKFVVCNVGKCYHVYTYQKEYIDEIDDLVAIIDTDYAEEYAGGSKNGTVSLRIDIEESKEFMVNNFVLSKEMTGRYWHENGYGKVFEAGCLIKDRNNEVTRVCYFTGGDFTNSWKPISIAFGFVNFLNKLAQFETLEDYVAYEGAILDEQWEHKDVCEKILNLAKVIDLYKKYKEINRTLSITHEMEELINRRLRSLLKNYQESDKNN